MVIAGEDGIIAGVPGARFWGDHPPGPMQRYAPAFGPEDGDKPDAYLALSGGGTFRIACNPDDVTLDSALDFDPEDMTRLFERGYADARCGYPWELDPLELGGPRHD